MPVPEGCPWGYEDFFVMLSSRGLEEVENEGCLSCYPHLLLVELGLGAKQLLLEAPHLPWSRWHEVKKLYDLLSREAAYNTIFIYQSIWPNLM